MANISVIFNSTSTGLLNPKLECYLNNSNEVFLKIYCGDGDDYENKEMQCITLDKSTAIKLVKVLRTEISKIKENE